MIAFIAYPRGSGGKISASVSKFKPDSAEDPPCMWACCTLNRRGSNVLLLVWCGSLEKGVAAQVSSSSPDCGSNLRGPSQNSPRVAANITKLN
ncbi:hypothetical protein AVEN_201087-1 [Araneus ventricosus]|uniref:Uncharacterized protein n=1 Tax=Araneus ventricosus TaxID=182803 RepID=A0A4Y2FWR9_ARAVE|nr:hypothetical protein AVEN_201087-1 [Araneus ventricosus]